MTIIPNLMNSSVTVAVVLSPSPMSYFCSWLHYCRSTERERVDGLHALRFMERDAEGHIWIQDCSATICDGVGLVNDKQK